MDRWCCQFLLGLCLTVIIWNVVKTDDENFRNHGCTYFYRLDLNKNLKLDWDDFFTMATRILLIDTSLNVVAKATQTLTLLDQLLKFFPLVNTTLANAILSGGVPLKVFLKSLEERRYTPEYQDQIRAMVNFFLSVFNSEGNDLTLTPCELSHAYEVFKVPIIELIPAFLDKDHNRDGLIQWDECHGNAVKYFIDAPLDDPSNTWAGSVLKCIDVVNGDQSKLPPPIAKVDLPIGQ